MLHSCLFPYIFLSLHICISLKCGAQANLEKQLSPLVLLKTCLWPQEKSTHHNWKGCYTMARHASTPWITQHKHQHFITQEWTFSCQDFTHLRYGHFLQIMKFCPWPFPEVNPQEAAWPLDNLRRKTKALAKICIYLVTELMVPALLTNDTWSSSSCSFRHWLQPSHCALPWKMDWTSNFSVLWFYEGSVI